MDMTMAMNLGKKPTIKLLFIEKTDTVTKMGILHYKKILFVLILMRSVWTVGAQTQDPIMRTKEDEQWNRCSHLSLNNDGDTVSCVFCAKYLSKEYSFQTSYIDKQPYSLRIYHNDLDNESLVAEFCYYKNEWHRCDFHVKSVYYRYRLLRFYLKQKDSVQYDQIWHE